MSTDQIESELRSIEHALHAALVRQLRVISLMAVLLGVAGYFVGHFVAEEQSRSDVAPLTAQIEELQQQLHDVIVTRRLTRIHSPRCISSKSCGAMKRPATQRPSMPC